MIEIRHKNCGGRLIKKYNIEYHKLGKVIQLSKDEYVCLKCCKSTEIEEKEEEVIKNERIYLSGKNKGKY